MAYAFCMCELHDTKYLFQCKSLLVYLFTFFSSEIDIDQSRFSKNTIQRFRTKYWESFVLTHNNIE